MSRLRLAEKGGYLRQHWRRLSLYGLGGMIGLLLIVQLAFPWGNMPLYMTIDGVDVSAASGSDATKKLDEAYKKLPVDLYFGNSSKSYRQPKPSDIGLSVSTGQQVASAAYPWWLRIVPTSLWWAHSAVTPEAPDYKRDDAKTSAYIEKELGQSCDVKAANATLTYKDKKLQVVPAIDGGTCKLDDVHKQLQAATPRLNKHDVRVPMVQHPAKIHDGEAKEFAAKLTTQTKDGVAIWAGDKTVTAAQNDMLSWLDFTAPDTGIVATVNAARSGDFMTKQLLPKVAVAAGTSYVTTLDFTETARTNGPNGVTLDTDATIASLNEWLADTSKKPVAKTKPVAPNIVYKRNYTPTDTGMSALIAQFAESHPGTFGVSFVELDGQHRRATYQDDKIYRTASTYKLFVAYGALKRVESGAWHWSDQVQGGRDLTKCLDDMIVKSDNACGEAMLSKIGYSTLTKEIQAIGLSKSSFMHSFPETTAGDLTTFVGALQSGQLLNPSSTNTLLSAMKRNVYRQGIPAGASGQTADKVGFLDAFLHDASIVYSPRGTYALSIMTEGSSWATIADLTRQIEKLRAQG